MITKRNGENVGGNRQRGFSLVEVLISLVVMSVGMLGVAGLYVKSMQAGRTSLFHHNAITLAGDIADRIRANPTAGLQYQDPIGADHNCVVGGVDCSAAEMAAHDVMLWQAQADDTLPRGGVTVVFTAAGAGGPSTYQITVAWDEPGLTPSYVITIPVLGT